MKNKNYIFYHIFIATNWFDIVTDQLNYLKSSNLLNDSFLKIGVVYGVGINKDDCLNKLQELLNGLGDYEIMYFESNGCCGESPTLKKMIEFSRELIEDANILYIHTKVVSQHNSEREVPVREWRKMMEYFLIEKWEYCLEKLNSGYDCCGINYQDHAANINGKRVLIKIFNGNFFWAKSDYIKKLNDSFLFESRYSSENLILSSNHIAFSFLNVPPSYDLYYNIYENYKNN